MYYAKSDPPESIMDHTNKLLNNLELLKNLYGKEIVKKVSIEENRFWELMKIICIYHDLGKVFTAFQNVIRKKLNMELLPTRFNYDEIKHEQISPMFVPIKELELTRDERKLVYQAIYYHHERGTIHLDRSLLQEVLEEDIKPNLENIKKEIQIPIFELNTFYLGFVEGTKRIKEGDELYIDYCIMKGLLHRLDHSSSANIQVEDITKEEVGNFVQDFMKSKGFELNDLQRFAKESEGDNLIVIGSTGIGKTEAALEWSKRSKTFFTLPLRVSINAIYDRILEKIRYNHVGLLHGTALEYLEDKEEFKNELQKVEQTRNLYDKITTCTIDQIFTFVFKYRGYEKMYSTLSYTKVVIDEIQAYSPEIVSIILKGLQMINNIGGKFMIMTATLPRIYKEELEKMGVEFKYKEFIKPIKRHKIKIEDDEIRNNISTIIEKGKNSKVLVIVNTINKAIELYKEIKALDVENVRLLHSRFIQNDRQKKEEDLKSFSNDINKSGIWITTQIVEASLDIDFDYLYTEMSTLDSLFQRLGRCYRSRKYIGDECNVFIYVKNTSGIKYVYDEEINKKSIELLKPFSGNILEERVKVDLVDKLYSKENLNDTEFYKKFKKGLEILDNIMDYDTNKNDAQKILRNIDNITVIPRTVYEKNMDLFKEYEAEKSYNKKSKIRVKINKLTTSINASNIRKLGDRIVKCPYIEEVYIIYTKYDNEIGLLLEKDEEYELEERFM